MQWDDGLGKNITKLHDTDPAIFKGLVDKYYEDHPDERNDATKFQIAMNDYLARYPEKRPNGIQPLVAPPGTTGLPSLRKRRIMR